MSRYAAAAFIAQLGVLDGRQHRIDGRTVAESVDGVHAWAEQIEALHRRVVSPLHFGQWPGLPDLSNIGAYYAALWDATVQARTFDVTAGDEEAA